MQSGQKTTVRVHTRLDDLTPAMHIGNASVLRIIEEARMFFLGYPVNGRPPFCDGILEILHNRALMLIGQQTIEYLGEMFYSPEPHYATFWIGHIGGSSATLCTEIRDAPDAEPIVKCDATMVMIHHETGKTWPLPDDVRAHFARYQADPIVLRPRPGQA